MVTIQDIAERIGVSKTTVSLVLNNRGDKLRISGRTCDRIRKIAGEMGYCRNGIAYAMTTGRTNVIGLVGGVWGSYGLDIIRGATGFFNNNGYSISLLNKDKGMEMAAIARTCVEQRFAGVICTSLSEGEIAVLRAGLERIGTPMALVDNAFSNGMFSHVLSDDFDGAMKVAEHFFRLGHRKFAHITSGLDSSGSRERHSGFCAGLKKHGLRLPKEAVGIVDKYYELTDSFAGTVRRVLAETGATAVFCASDPIAMKVLRVVSAAGMRVPEDVSVAGYAGLDYTLWSTPPLTTVRQPFEEMGATAAELLLSEIKEKLPPREIKLPVELLVRQSTMRIKKPRLKR